jgi:hypothetical protein
LRCLILLTRIGQRFLPLPASVRLEYGRRFKGYMPGSLLVRLSGEASARERWLFVREARMALKAMASPASSVLAKLPYIRLSEVSEEA